MLKFIPIIIQANCGRSTRSSQPGPPSSATGTGSQQGGVDAYVSKQLHEMHKPVTELQKDKANMAMANTFAQELVETGVNDLQIATFLVSGILKVPTEGSEAAA